MKKSSIKMCVSLGAFALLQVNYAQNDLVVFNDGPEKFYLYVNGVQQNQMAEKNVRVKNIRQPWVKVKVVFEDNKRIPDLTTNAQFVWEAEEKKGWEFVYQIVNKTGKYKLKPYSAAPISSEKTDGQTTINYVSEESVPNVSVSSPAMNTSPAQSSQTITTTTVVSSGIPANSNPANGNINISISPTGANIQIHDGVSTSSSNVGYTTSVVSTTVTSSSAAPAAPSTIHPSQPVAIKCAVTPTEFENIKKNIASKSFEDSKLTVAKQISDSKCLKSEQVRDIMKLFSFEQTRLEFAKYAYKRVADKDNYYLVNDAFQFENSIEELNESIGK